MDSHQEIAPSHSEPTLDNDSVTGVVVHAIQHPDPTDSFKSSSAQPFNPLELALVSREWAVGNGDLVSEEQHSQAGVSTLATLTAPTIDNLLDPTPFTTADVIANGDQVSSFVGVSVLPTEQKSELGLENGDSDEAGNRKIENDRLERTQPENDKTEKPENERFDEKLELENDKIENASLTRDNSDNDKFENEEVELANEKLALIEEPGTVELKAEEPSIADGFGEADEKETMNVEEATPPKKRGRKPSIKLLESDGNPQRRTKKQAQEGKVDETEPEEFWVQCDKCEKWRKLEFPWNKRRFSCHQLGIICEEDCDCDPPCSCKNISKMTNASETYSPSTDISIAQSANNPESPPSTGGVTPTKQDLLDEDAPLQDSLEQFSAEKKTKKARAQKATKVKSSKKRPTKQAKIKVEATCDGHSDSDYSFTSDSEEDDTLYCCGKKYNPNYSYVGCSSYGECKGVEWYHLECVNLTSRQAQNLEEWFCETCTKELTAEEVALTKRKRKAEREESDESFSDEETPLSEKLRKKRTDEGEESDEETPLIAQLQFQSPKTSTTKAKRPKRPHSDDVPLLSIVNTSSHPDKFKISSAAKKLLPLPSNKQPKGSKLPATTTPPAKAGVVVSPRVVEPSRVDLPRPRPPVADFATIRAKAREALQEVLGETLAKAIEESVLKAWKTEQAYKVQMRELVQNVRDPRNPELKARILSGELTAEQLGTATAADLASSSVVVERSRAVEDALQMAYKADSVRAFIAGRVQQTKDEIEETLFPSFPIPEQHTQPFERKVGFLNRKLLTPLTKQTPTVAIAAPQVVQSFEEFADVDDVVEVVLVPTLEEQEEKDKPRVRRQKKEPRERKHSSNRISLKHRSRHEKRRGEVRVMHARPKDRKHKKHHRRDRKPKIGERKLPNPDHISWLDSPKSKPEDSSDELADIPDEEIEVILAPSTLKPPPPVSAVRVSLRDPRLHRSPPTVALPDPPPPPDSAPPSPPPPPPPPFPAPSLPLLIPPPPSSPPPILGTATPAVSKSTRALAPTPASSHSLAMKPPPCYLPPKKLPNPKPSLPSTRPSLPSIPLSPANRGSLNASTAPRDPRSGPIGRPAISPRPPNLLKDHRPPNPILRANGRTILQNLASSRLPSWAVGPADSGSRERTARALRQLDPRFRDKTT